MIIWMQDYWYLCVAALLIGMATAAWIWLGGRRRRESDNGILDMDPPQRRTPAARAEPLAPAKPVIDMAQPVTFTAPPPPAPVPVPVADGASPRLAIAPAQGAPDDLRLIKGIGPKLASLLASLGVTRFDQIAAWTAEDVTEVDRHLGTFAGRIERDQWVAQAGYLARGDTEGFAAKFGAV